ncbi:MAG: endonuclease/exonuclease/phosphatase family protein [Paracoccaceae bacterium]
MSSSKHDHAWHRNGPGRGNDRRKTAPCLRRVGRYAASLICCASTTFFTASEGLSDSLRVATFNTELGRDGPGLFLRDILRQEDPQIKAAARVIVEVAPDIIALQGIDYDLTGLGLNAFADVVAQTGQSYPYRFSLPSNRGSRTGLDMNGDGHVDGPDDAQGYGEFAGAGGMAILSKYPVLEKKVQDLSQLLWRDLPDSLFPQFNGKPFPSSKVHNVQRLSTSGHWVIPIVLPDDTVISIMAFHATPPVFDGPEDRNGRRNHDEILFWQRFLDGSFGPAPQSRFVLLGDANLDPEDGDGRKGAIRALLSDQRLQDPLPRGEGRREIANPEQTGNPMLDTADWSDPLPGNLRVDYVLPSKDWDIEAAGVHWPVGQHGAAQDAKNASRHRLVWGDLVHP